MKFKIRLASLLLAAGVLATIAGAAYAQPAYPNKPIRLVVPFSAGGPTDVLARAIGQKLGDSLGQPIIVESRPGAGGNIASDYVAKAPPDGYTLILGTVGTHAINASLYSKLPFDTVQDFTPIALVASATIVMVVHPSVPAKTVKELLALAKSKPHQLNFASPGSGTPQHLAGELFKTVAGVEMVHVPYKGAAPALTDLLGGQVSLGFVSLPAALPYIKAEKLMALGVTASKRSAVAPEVPTIAESGLPGYENSSWSAIGVTTGTPKPIVARLHKEFSDILKLPDIQARHTEVGAQIVGGAPEQFHAYLKAEVAKFGKLVKAAGIQSAGG